MKMTTDPTSLEALPEGETTALLPQAAEQDVMGNRQLTGAVAAAQASHPIVSQGDFAGAAREDVRILPHESLSTYEKLHAELSRNTGGYHSGFEDHLVEEAADARFGMRRWENAKTAIPNFVKKRLAKSTAGLPVPTAMNGDQKSATELAVQETASMLELIGKVSGSEGFTNAMVLFGTKNDRRLAKDRRDLEAERAYGATEQIRKLRQDRSSVEAMEKFNDDLAIRIRNSPYEMDADRPSANSLHLNRVKGKLSCLVTYVTPSRKWTDLGRELLALPWTLDPAFATMLPSVFFDTAEYFGVESAADAFLARDAAVETLRIRQFRKAQDAFLAAAFKQVAIELINLANPGASASLSLSSEELLGQLKAVGLGPNVVLIEILYRHGSIISSFDEEIDDARHQRAAILKKLSKLRSRKRLTERAGHQGLKHERLAEWKESYS